MAFPVEKYNYVEHDMPDGRKRVIALSTYCGDTVKGTATCALDDEYDFEAGKKLAAARCEVKVSNKRAKFAADRLDYLVRTAEELRQMISKAAVAAGETAAAAQVAQDYLDELLKGM